ncbi:Protein of unknown function [Gryllus bimaculatus]|nr:Protein of unknown function [Gryllus bimaculatus]
MDSQNSEECKDDPDNDETETYKEPKHMVNKTLANAQTAALAARATTTAAATTAAAAAANAANAAAAVGVAFSFAARDKKNRLKKRGGDAGESTDHSDDARGVYTYLVDRRGVVTDAGMRLLVLFPTKCCRIHFKWVITHRVNADQNCSWKFSWRKKQCIRLQLHLANMVAAMVIVADIVVTKVCTFVH